MFKKIAAILSVLAALPGINIVHSLVKAVRAKNLSDQDAYTQALASSILAKQGNLDKVIAAYASAKAIVDEEWARLRAMVGRGAPTWLPNALKEGSQECGFYTTLLMRLNEAKQAGFCPIMGVMESDTTETKHAYDRRVAEDFKFAWVAGKTSYDGR